MGEFDRAKRHVVERVPGDVLDDVLFPGERVVWSREPDWRSRWLLLASVVVPVASLLGVLVGGEAFAFRGSWWSAASPLTVLMILFVGCWVFLRELGGAIFGGADALYVVTQRRALVVGARLGARAVELGDGVTWTAIEHGIRVHNPATGERLVFRRLRQPLATLVEIEDARRHTRNAQPDRGETDGAAPLPAGPTAVEKFAARKRLERDGG